MMMTNRMAGLHLRSLQSLLLVVVFGLSLCIAVSPEDATITSGVIWNDTDGNPVHAHGGGIVVVNSTYYLVGASQKQGSGWLSEGINVYSSQDLQHWKFEAQVLKNTSIVASFPGPYRIERPKIVFCEATNLYVLWFHLDTSDFKARQVGVATSPHPAQPFTFHAGFQPDGQPSLDMGLYKDTTGAYLVRSVNNQFAGISKLSPDFLNTTGIISRGPKVEGQAIFLDKGSYYLWGSHLTGWSANPAVLSSTTSSTLHGAVWTSLGNPSNDGTTFNSQSTYILPYTHPDGSVLYIYMGDRWNFKGPGSVGAASYVWLPLVRSASGEWEMKNYDSWKIADFTS